jgi:ABC-type polysaccharide/polyol phosphate export permease
MTASLPGTQFARNLVERRSLLFQLVRRDFEQRFVGSAIGWLWSLIHPLVLLVSWYFAFRVCLRIQVDPVEVTESYPLFLFAGMLPWLLFSETVQRSSTSMLEQANLITKTVFPAEIVPVSLYLSSLVSHLMALALAIAGAGVILGQLTANLFLLPVYIVILGLFAVGVGWIVAGLQVYLRDTAQVLSVILTFWFWMTPIFVAEQRFPARLRFLLTANPLAYLVRAYRDILLFGRTPGLRDMAVVTVFALGTFCLGGLFFRQMKHGFADVL